MVSGVSSENPEEKVLELGANSFQSKPIDAKLLTAEVSRLLAERPALSLAK